jgi:hypothetical protein
MAQQFGVRTARGLLLLFVAILLGHACSNPPPPAAVHPVPSVSAATPTPALARCGLVRRAERTWVGFAEGMSLADMVPVAQASAAVVRSLDAAVCSYVEGDREQLELRPYRRELAVLAAQGGNLEVTQVLWQDPSLAVARVELEAREPAARSQYVARVVRNATEWKLDRFAARPLDAAPRETAAR